MIQGVLVFLGGGLGSLARWGINSWIGTPLSTLLVNYLGSFAIGYLLGKFEHPAFVSFAVVGFLGGFTTFSGFSIDFTRYGPNQWAGYLYVLASVAGAILLCWLGSYLSVRI